MVHALNTRHFRPNGVLVISPSFTTTTGDNLTTYFPDNNVASTTGYSNPVYPGLHFTMKKTADTGTATTTVGIQEWLPGASAWTNMVDTDGNAVIFVAIANDENDTRHLYIHPALFTDATDGLVADAGKLSAAYSLPAPARFRVYVTVAGTAVNATLSLGCTGLK